MISSNDSTMILIQTERHYLLIDCIKQIIIYKYHIEGKNN